MERESHHEWLVVAHPGDKGVIIDVVPVALRPAASYSTAVEAVHERRYRAVAAAGPYAALVAACGEYEDAVACATAHAAATGGRVRSL